MPPGTTTSSHEATPLTGTSGGGVATIVDRFLNDPSSVEEDDKFNETFTEETKTSMALPLLVKNITLDEIPPVLYLKAVGECFSLALGISWIITLIFAPDIVQNNPLKTRLGYNNVCVGWDMKPANTFAAVVWPFVTYMAFRFCYINFVRIKLQKDEVIQNGHSEWNRKDRFIHSFNWWSNLGFMLSVVGFTLCLLIPPWESVWWHTVPFLFYIITRFFIVFAICLDYWEDVTPKGKIFLTYYGFVSIVLPLTALGEYTYYEIYEEKSFWPWYLTMFMDYTWFVCSMLTSKFVPSSVSVSRRFDLKKLSTNNTSGGSGGLNNTV